MSSLVISYSRKDLSVVQQLEQALLANDHAVWRDQESIYGGQQWPKAIGEAIASRDFFLLVWSQHAAAAHFVEFEWNTALALKKVILPCLLDDTPLPPSLRAINGIACEDLETGLPRVLQSLQQPLPASDPSHAEAVINKLQTISPAAPEQVVQAAKTLFAQQHWNVQGNVYQAAGDINVTLAPPPEKPEKKLLERWQTWVGLIGGILAIVLGVLELREKIAPSEASKNNTVQPSKAAAGYLRVLVIDSTSRAPLAGVTITVEEVSGDTTVRRAETTSDGGVHFANISAPHGARARVYAKREGYNGKNEYTFLPGPLKLELEKIK